MRILISLSLLIAICFIIRGLISLFAFRQTVKLIKKRFPLYLKEKEDYSKSGLPFIFLLIPVFNEQENICSFLENLSNLNYDKTKYKVIIISTEKEYYKQNAKIRSTIEIINNFLCIQGQPNFIRIHYPSPYGHKTDQLNYAIHYLNERYPKAVLRKSFYGVLDADSIIHPDALKIFVNSLKENPESVFQQLNLWFKNFNVLPKNINGYFMKAFAFLQSYYMLCYEIPMIRRKYKFPYQMKYCVGNGLFIRGEILEKVKGFPPIIEDTRLGHVCSFLKINIHLLPALGVTEVTTGFVSLIKQISVWFTGEFLIFKDFNIARSINKKINLLYAIYILFYKLLKNLWWLNEGVLFIMGIGVGLYVKDLFIILIYILILIIRVFIPILLLANKSNWLLAPYNISIKKLTSLEKIIILIAAVFVFCFSFLGPYLGIFRMIKSYLFRKSIVLPKTER